MTDPTVAALQAEPDGEGWGAETFTLTEVGEAEVATPRAELPDRGQANLPVPADAQSTAVWMLRDGDQRTTAAVIEVTDADGRLLGRWGWLDLADEPHRETVKARSVELGMRLIAGGATRGMCLTGVAAEIDPELSAVVVSVSDHFDQDGYFIGRGAGFVPAADEAETERRRQVCNNHLRATPEG